MMTDSIIKELLFTVDFRNKRKYKEKRLGIGRLKGNYLRVFAKSFYNPDRLKNKTRFFFFFIHVALLLFLLLSCCRHGCCCCCWKGISKWTQKRNCNFLTPYFTKAKAKANLCIENRFRLKNHSKSSASFFIHFVWVFSNNNNTITQQTNVLKSSNSFMYWDLKSRPLSPEFPPKNIITG